MGDIFNASRPDSQSIDLFRTSLAVMKSHGLPVYAIQGQHDRSTPPWPTAVCGSEITYVHKSRFQPITDGPVFYGLDQHPVSVELQASLNEVPKDVDVLIMHQLAREVFPLDGAWDFDTEWVPEHIKGLFIGDYHVATDFKWKGGKAYYSGSTYMCSISESPNKSFLHVTINEGIKTERIPLKTRGLIKLLVDDEKSLQSAVDFMHKSLQMRPTWADSVPIMYLEYLVSVPDVMKTIEPLVKGKAILWPVPTSNRVEWHREGAASTTELQHVTMESCVGVFLDAGTEANSLLLELLANPSTEEVLEHWRVKKNVV